MEQSDQSKQSDEVLVPGTPRDENIETDKAVEDIVRHEADDELAAQDRAAREAATKISLWARLRRSQSGWWHNPRKRWTSVACIVFILAAVATIPLSRYEIIGIFARQSLTVEVADSKTGDPVSGASVQIGDAKATTDSGGKAVLRPHMGYRRVRVSKDYYAAISKAMLIDPSSARSPLKVELVALGRQVKVRVANIITGQPLGGATLNVAGTTAKTNDSGLATVTLASNTETTSATISLAGYNTTKVTITAGGTITQNTFSITPAGKVYLLSNSSGTIDVVKTNLDGGDRQTVLAGTGQEDPTDTTLMASSDWRYIALLARRSGNTASLYLIDTASGDKLTTIDSGNANFEMVGWIGDQFVYQASRNDIPVWQSGKQLLKSFNPTTGRGLLLDQNKAAGTGADSYTAQYFGGKFIVGDQLIYSRDWSGTVATSVTGSTQQAELVSVNADGSGYRVIKEFAPTAVPALSISIATEMGMPGQVLIDFSDQGSDNFYSYENGTISPDTSLVASNFTQAANTYFYSPSGNQLFWSALRDAKNAFVISDPNGNNQKQLATLSNYVAYGWFTDSYVLLSSNNSLYIMSANGGTPLRIADYYANSPH